MHAMGSSLDDMSGIADTFSQFLPDTAFLIPAAPYPYKWPLSRTNSDRRTWLGTNPLRLLRTAFNASSHPSVGFINDLIDETLERLNLNDQNLSFFGFSEGGLMASYCALSRPEPCAAVVAHSSTFVGHIEPQSFPPTLVLVGDQDLKFFENLEKTPPPFPLSTLSRSYARMFSYQNGLERLKKLGVPVTYEVAPCTDHEITLQSFMTAKDFLLDAQQRTPSP